MVVACKYCFNIAILALFCVGCVAGGSYRQSTWINANRGSDWDIDSALCLEYSEIFSDEDWSEVKKIKEDAYRLKAASLQVNQGVSRNSSGEALYFASEAIAGLMSFVAHSDESSAEAEVRENKFSSCMAEKNWQNSAH